MFSPEILLIRPATKPEHQLDILLQNKAAEGVEIKILVYNSIFTFVKKLTPATIMIFSDTATLINTDIEKFCPNGHDKLAAKYQHIRNIKVF